MGWFGGVFPYFWFNTHFRYHERWPAGTCGPRISYFVSHNCQLYRKRLADPSRWPWRARLLQTYLTWYRRAAGVPTKNLCVHGNPCDSKCGETQLFTHQETILFKLSPRNLNPFSWGIPAHMHVCGQGALEPQLACCTCGSVPTPGF